ncbi:hypothetical protein ACHAWX_001984 [Stephanocyclus meneghinianus]
MRLTTSPGKPPRPSGTSYLSPPLLTGTLATLLPVLFIVLLINTLYLFHLHHTQHYQEGDASDSRPHSVGSSALQHKVNLANFLIKKYDLSMKSLAARLNELFLASGNTKNRGELRLILQGTLLDASDLEDIISEVSHENLPTTEQQPNQAIARGSDDNDPFVFDPNSPHCKCLDCIEDPLCGGLWKGIGFYNEQIKSRSLKIHIVVSHCKSPLHWLNDFIDDLPIQIIHIITKCGNPPVGAPESATTVTLPNVGRCDHSYAYYISNILPGLVPVNEQDDSIVVFLKDDISYQNMHQLGEWSEMKYLTHVAASNQGFACGINSVDVLFGATSFSLSAFHHIKTLENFAMETYERNQKGYVVVSGEFKSPYETLGYWWDALGVVRHGQICQVCYGGVFAASVPNIRKLSDQFWKSLEINLSRGNSIQEGHYAERSWALLLSTPLQPFQESALLRYSDGVYINLSSMHGALLRARKVFLHIGVTATQSTEALMESLTRYSSELDNDGYRLAVHGKYNPSLYDFPNIDRLGGCMWSDVIKSSFPGNMMEATMCPKETLPNLSNYMKKAAKDDHNMIILNPWLARPGTADSLGLFLDPVWEVHTIIYYRRYYEWITCVFEHWRVETLGQITTPNTIPYSSFRYIDFIREYCKRLFYGHAVHEDGYPVRRFDEMPNRITSYDYDPTSNSHVEDLTDLNEYTYFVANEYSGKSRFHRHVTIVNYHQNHTIESNFFCRVLHDANNACRAAVSEELTLQGRKNSATEEFIQVNREFPIDASHVVEDLAIAAYKTGRLNNDKSSNIQPLISRWIQMVQMNLKQNGSSLTNLPIECLYEFEVDRLLEVSLAYEKRLLPEFYESSNGKAALIHEFGKWRFCSVDTAKVLGDSKWDFLFKAQI